MEVQFYGTVEVQLACVSYTKSLLLLLTRVPFQLTQGKPKHLLIEVRFI